MTRQVSGQFIRFAGVGLIGLVVDVGHTLFLIALGLDPLIARIFAIALAVFTTWRLNRALTFGASATSQASEGLRYSIVALVVAVVNYVIYASLILNVPDLSPALAVIVAVGVSTSISFPGYRLFAFKRSA